MQHCFVCVCVCVFISDLAVMTELVTILFTLMGSYKQLQVVAVEDFTSDVRTPVTAASSHLVWDAAVLRHRVTPQHVHYLQEEQIKGITGADSKHWMNIVPSFMEFIELRSLQCPR